MTDAAGMNFELQERMGKSLFSTGITPDNIYRLVKALEKIAEELSEIATVGVRMR